MRTDKIRQQAAVSKQLFEPLIKAEKA